MYINETGVGIGTTAPESILHIVEDTGTAAAKNAGTIILDHEDDNGQSSIVFRSRQNRNSDYGYINYQDDYNNTSGSERSLLTIGVENDYGATNLDCIALMASGNVGIGTTSPTYTLQVAGSVGGTSFTTTSDDRLKSNEIPITDALESLMKLNPMTYDKYDNMDKSGNYVTESGLISQDIWYQVPELRHIVSLGSEYSDVSSSTVPTPIDVSNNELLEDADYNNLGWSTTTPSGVKYTDLIAYLIKAVQELNIQRQQEKDALQASHDSLQTSHDSLQASHDSLQTSHDSLQTSHDSLQASHDSLKDEMAELKALLQEKSII